MNHAATVGSMPDPRYCDTRFFFNPNQLDDEFPDGVVNDGRNAAAQRARPKS
ncbi:hypothetical protein [Pseudarthrobacter sp. NIBRBAC000502770]|uniref:hypothetical protein n=1 Tax=Pseudarthrobacter sp. NIBRBAC000502770 TaxID=2590785 RepID=UPI00143CC4E5|nr:hypothetical protein [Pseudarthrobacter sp. NIBRBAC000502770]